MGNSGFLGYNSNFWQMYLCMLRICLTSTLKIPKRCHRYWLCHMSLFSPDYRSLLLPVFSLPGAGYLPQLGWRKEGSQLLLSSFPMHCYMLNVMPGGPPANWMCKLKSFKSLVGVIQIFIPTNREEIRQIHPGAIFPSLSLLTLVTPVTC